MMADDDMTAAESAILIVLMAEAREVLNTELKEWYGLDVRKEQRDKLTTKLHYIACKKSGRTYALQLADDGWVRVQKDLDFTHRGAGALSSGLKALQKNLRDRVLTRAECASFTELFAIKDVRAVEPQRAFRATLRLRIIAAYEALADEPQAFVSLSRLRPFFADVPREDLDEALRRLATEGDANIVPESNQRLLSEADIEASLRIGGQDNHLLAIGV